MWSLIQPISGITNTVIIPTDGMITVSKPDGVEVLAYVNGQLTTPITQFWGGTGNSVYFEVKDTSGAIGTVVIKYGDSVSTIEVPAAIMSTGTLIKMSAESTNIMEDKTMTPQDTINLFANPNTMGAGGMGGGLGAGLVGGLLGGALLNNGGGGLLGGGNNNGAGSTLVLENAIAAQTALTNARFDAQAQAAINASVERTNAATLLAIATSQAALGVETAKGFGETNTQNALNAAAVGVQIEKTAAAGALASALGQRDILEAQARSDAATAAQLAATQFTLASAIKADGDQTRAYLVAQNDLNLNRQLVTAQNEIIELRGDGRLAERTRGIEVTTTNNINQMQQQQQQQQQYGQLYNAIWALGQNIQSTNSAINVGGTQTASPTNTNTNIR